VFFLVALSIWTLMHVYLGWRVWSLPFLAGPSAHRWLVAALALLWVSYLAARILERLGYERVAYPLEWLGAAWLGVLFLTVATLLAADVVTGFGLLLPRYAPTARTAALVVASVLSAAAFVQGIRPPVLRRVSVPIHHLPAGLAGLRIVQLSDLHLGSMLSGAWFSGMAARAERLNPDVIVVSGDLVDGNATRVERMLPNLRLLHARLGVWAVTGNHEFYAGVDRCVALFREAGYHVLRDAWAEVEPGLVFAGVDDLTARRQFGLTGDPLPKALDGRPQGVTVFLCHSPWRVEEAARMGVDLMLSGHTHGGQIWPFDYLVKLTYPYLAGRFTVGGMTLWVSRGTGTWGPRMRLWRPAEITLLTLTPVP
jgi:predicted MPP superfamily phosphohydrolase